MSISHFYPSRAALWLRPSRYRFLPLHSIQRWAGAVLVGRPPDRLCFHESGSFEVYVRPSSPDATAASGAKWLISKAAVILPHWRADGKQLFYTGYSNPDLLTVDIDTSHGFQAGTPRRLFTAPSVANRGWDLAPDGKPFLFIASANGARAAPFTGVLNWQAGLKK